MSGTTALQSKMEKLRDDYQHKLPHDIRHIRALWKNLLYVKWDNKAFLLFHRLVHNLAGSAGTYGFTEIGALASRLVTQLQALEETHAPPGDRERSRISGGLERLEQMLDLPQQLEVLEAGANLTPAPAELPGRATRVLMLEDDTDQAEVVQLYLEHHGYEVRVIDTAEALPGALDVQIPDFMLVDVMLSEGASAGIDMIKTLRDGVAAGVPVLFMSARGDLQARLEAVRAGGVGYFAKPIDMPELVKKIEYLKAAADTHYRVLVVDDDADLAAYHTEVLQQAGLETRKLTIPVQIIQALHEFRPDLVLMDLHMPKCSGGELAQIIRQESRFADLPIVFVSSEQDPLRQNAALAQGGDVFLVKPVDESQLVEAVTNRVKRARMLACRMQFLDQQDPQTGLINQRALLSHLNSAIGELAGAEATSSLLFIDIDKFWKLRDEVGFAWSELVMIKMASLIRRELGPTEHIARVGNASFVTLLPGVSPATALSLSNRLRKVIANQAFKADAQSFMLTVSIGLAPLSESYRSGDEWLSGAALACDIARSSGDNTSYLHQPESNSQVEQEQYESCAELLKAALEADAFSCVYQPIASLHGDPSEQYDVLLRMNDAEGREVLPARFLSVARKERLSDRIDRWVTQHAVKVLSQRHQAGNRTTFFVKLSPTILFDKQFTGWLENQVRTADLPASTLVFQFSESVISEHTSEAVSFCNRLRDLGCGIALEHFGNSLGSLQLLQQLPVDYIKIDGSFVRGLTTNKANLGSMRQILEAANAKGISVIASFIEDAASLGILWECGVQFIQGNFLQAPSSKLDFMFDEHQF